MWSTVLVGYSWLAAQLLCAACMFSGCQSPLSAPTDLFTCCPSGNRGKGCPLSIEGLPLLPLPGGGCPLLHYHRGSHHPSSLTSQCPSSSLSIPARAGPATLHCVTFPSSAVQCTVEEVFSALLFRGSLECTDGPGHAIRPGVGTNTCSLHFNKIISILYLSKLQKYLCEMPNVFV